MSPMHKEGVVRRRIRLILRVLAEAEGPMSGRAAAEALRDLGADLQPRMVRYYLERLDARGWTERSGRGGRRLTDAGREESRVVEGDDEVYRVAARLDDLAYRMTYDPARGEGLLVLNETRIRAADWPAARPVLGEVLDAGLGMGRRVRVARNGESLDGRRVERGEAAIGTVCSVSLNGVLRRAGIMVISRFGGLLEIREGVPVRFTQLVHYDGTTIDPVEIFARGRMMSVRRATRTGSGLVGASFREIPAAALGAAREAIGRMRARELDGVLAVGRPGRPLLGIPVLPGRAGLVVAAGLNPIAALEESGIETRSRAMACMAEARDLAPPGAWPGGRGGAARSRRISAGSGACR